MGVKLSPFVAWNKPWLVRKILSDYFKAKKLFDKMNHSMEFERIRQLSDILYNIKENLYLIYRRISDPQKRTFERTPKAIPNQHEQDFMNNVGLLFHKTMVARELKYVLDHYAIDSHDYQETRKSLDIYRQRIDELFRAGKSLARQVLIDNCDCIEVLTYVVEHGRAIEKAIGVKFGSLLEEIKLRQKLTDPYFQVGEYCLQSGWPDRAKKHLTKSLQLNPQNENAKKLKESIPA